MIKAFEMLLVIAVILAIIARMRQKKAKQNGEIGTPPHRRPTSDGAPLGHGISKFLPRSMTVDTPGVFGEGNNSYANAVRNLLSQTFGPFNPEELAQQDSAWEEWLGLNPNGQEPRDLRNLLDSDIKGEFKARAFTILALPALRFSPFAWREKHLEDYNGRTVELGAFSDKLRDFAFGLIRINVDFILATPFDEKPHRALFDCNDYIAQALALLPENDPRAAGLFDRYQINDLIGGQRTNYSPFEDILGKPGVPEKWKVLADQKMRNIIMAQQTGQTNPRHKWEDALASYMFIIQTQLIYGALPYSVELFASQIEFALGLPKIADKEIIDPRRAQKILNSLAGDKWKDLRHRIVRYVLLESHAPSYSRFTIYSREDAITARSMLRSCGENDPEIRDRINELFSAAKLRGQELQRSAAEQQAKIDSVMNKMK